MNFYFNRHGKLLITMHDSITFFFTNIKNLNLKKLSLIVFRLKLNILLIIIFLNFRVSFYHTKQFQFKLKFLGSKHHHLN